MSKLGDINDTIKRLEDELSRSTALLIQRRNELAELNDRVASLGVDPHADPGAIAAATVLRDATFQVVRSALGQMERLQAQIVSTRGDAAQLQNRAAQIRREMAGLRTSRGQIEQAAADAQWTAQQNISTIDARVQENRGQLMGLIGEGE